MPKNLLHASGRMATAGLSFVLPGQNGPAVAIFYTSGGDGQRAYLNVTPASVRRFIQLGRAMEASAPSLAQYRASVNEYGVLVIIEREQSNA
jgi:hypothetical protein